MSWDKFDEEASREGEAFSNRYRSVWNPKKKTSRSRADLEDPVRKANIVHENRIETPASPEPDRRFGLSCLDEEWGQEGA